MTGKNCCCIELMSVGFFSSNLNTADCSQVPHRSSRSERHFEAEKVHCPRWVASPHGGSALFLHCQGWFGRFRQMLLSAPKVLTPGKVEPFFYKLFLSNANVIWEDLTWLSTWPNPLLGVWCVIASESTRFVTARVIPLAEKHHSKSFQALETSHLVLANWLTPNCLLQSLFRLPKR